MAQIHGIAWLIIGVLMAVFSWIVKSTAESGGMLIFFFIGIVFIIIGAVKLLLTKLKPEEPKKPKVHSHKMLHHGSHVPPHPQHQPKVCFGCGTKNPPNSMYCVRCGSRLR